MSSLIQRIKIPVILVVGIVAVVIVVAQSLQDPLAGRTLTPPTTLLAGAFQRAQSTGDQVPDSGDRRGVVGSVSRFTIETAEGQSSITLEFGTADAKVRLPLQLDIGVGSCVASDAAGKPVLLYVSQAGAGGPVMLRDVYQSIAFNQE